MFEESSQWFKELQEEICNTIEDLDCDMLNPQSPAKEGWTQSHKTIYGDVFEKGTVNFSKITSEFDPKFAKEIPGTEEHNRYSTKQELVCSRAVYRTAYKTFLWSLEIR